MPTLDIASDGPPPSRLDLQRSLDHAAALADALARGVADRADLTPAQRHALGPALARLHNAVAEAAAVFGHTPKGAR
ncbi:MAG: hypothetical protein Q8S73_36775 [Deltaproteobacteria bacterium]|nr:hypothetical protein [Myxococcales bacterium]MDP3219714.1 hypothetical protein [Deltaproteobacteria bacterium]